MTPKEKLIDLMRAAEESCPTDQPLFDAIADTMINAGVIVPPVKLGQTVWLIKPNAYRNKLVETEVEKIVFKSKMGLYMKLSCDELYETSCWSIGKTVFFTQEEAEMALAERSNKQ